MYGDKLLAARCALHPAGRRLGGRVHTPLSTAQRYVTTKAKSKKRQLAAQMRCSMPVLNENCGWGPPARSAARGMHAGVLQWPRYLLAGAGTASKRWCAAAQLPAPAGQGRPLAGSSGQAASGLLRFRWRHV